MKTLIPWLCVAALLGGAAFLYSSNQKKDTELATLRAASQEVEALRAESAELKKAQVPNEEIVRLRKDNEDLLRLRNEVRQMRDQQQQLTKQLGAAQNSAQQQQQQAQRLQVEAQQARAAAQQAQQTRQVTPQPLAAQDAANACINNLRQIDGAKQQWALENQKTAEAVPTVEQVAVYLKGSVLPACPAGGKYTLNAVGQVPVCSTQGHALPQ